MKTKNLRKKRVKRTRKKQTRRNVKRGGMKKTSPKQFNEARLELKEILEKEDLERSLSEELSPKWPETPRYDVDEHLGEPDEDIELNSLLNISNKSSSFGLRIYKDIDKKGTISTPNWTLIDGTFDVQNFRKRGIINTIKIINQTRIPFTLTINRGSGYKPTSANIGTYNPVSSSGILPRAQQPPAFIELPYGEITRDILDNIIIVIDCDKGGRSAGAIGAYTFAFGVRESDGLDPLYVIYER